MFNDTSGRITVTKLDVARRQLLTALKLWFEDADPVSIHTLVFAAYEIIHRLYRQKGLSNLLFDTNVIKDEYRSEFSKLLKDDASFFKHATKDINATKSFNPISNDLFLIMSVVGMDSIGESSSLGDIGSAFRAWLVLHHPDWFPENVIKNRIPIDRLENIRSIKKSDFFKAFLELRRDGIIVPH